MSKSKHSFRHLYAQKTKITDEQSFLNKEILPSSIHSILQ